LTSDFVDWSFVSQLSHELVSLNINVLFSSRGFWSFHIAGEELFGSLGSFLLECLGIVLFLVGSEKLIWVRARWNDHCGVSGTSENSSVVHDVLRNHFTTIVLAVVPLLLADDARVRALETYLTVLVGLHLFIQINY
jgi:hypothetical protein